VGSHRADDQRARDCHLGGRARPPHCNRRIGPGHGVWALGVLTEDTRREGGSAAVESLFAIVVLILLVTGVIQVALGLYARNVVAASAHEGARAAIERGRTIEEASAIARGTVEAAAGGLVDGLRIDVASQSIGDRQRIVVSVTGRVRPMGPVPVTMSLSSTATATGQVDVP
jgi:Flp pilus assembly protein TadG